MQQIGIWQVIHNKPKQLSASSVGLEKNLEDWIEDDPSLLEEGLEIVGRQIHVEGGILDLLALNPQGQWVVIELKSGHVRRSAVAQVLDYASCVANMSWNELRCKVEGDLRGGETSVDALIDEREEAGEQSPAARDVLMYVVGTGSYPGLERMVDFLSSVHDVPITLVSYKVFQIGDGHKILVRELREPEITTQEPTPRRTVPELCALADGNGIGDEFRTILNAAKEHEKRVYPSPYRASLMYAPAANHGRMLFTVRTWTRADGLLQLYVGPQAFAEFYPVTAEDVIELLGDAGWQRMTRDDVGVFVENLHRLFERIDEAEDGD